MNRRQRRLHLLAWLVIGLLSIAGVLIALAQRPPAPATAPRAAQEAPP